MAINFAGSLSGATGLDSKAMKFLDARYINTGEKIPKESISEALKDVTQRLKRLERRNHQIVMNIDDFRRKSYIQETNLSILKEAVDAQKTKITRLQSNMADADRLIRAIGETISANERNNLDVINTLSRKMGTTESNLNMQAQKIRIIEDNYETQRGTLSRLKETVDARISRMTILDLENILERMSAVETNVATKIREFNTKVEELNKLHTNFKRLTLTEIDFIRLTMKEIYSELNKKAEKPFYLKILQEIERKLQQPAL